jgi:hypothetical protein
MSSEKLGIIQWPSEAALCNGQGGKNVLQKLGMSAHTCNPSYLGSGGLEDPGSRTVPTSTIENLA